MDTTGSQDTDIENTVRQLLEELRIPQGFLNSINEAFISEYVTPNGFDKLLAAGWRHFGEEFYRYEWGTWKGDWYHVLPLRVRTADFILSKSQRRNLNRNADLLVSILPNEITDEVDDLFHRHAERFEYSRPQDLRTIVSATPATVPVEAVRVEVREGERLVAASFLDLGVTSASSIYGMFEPEMTSRGLGIFTMLKEIEYARDTRRTYYYPGYAYHEPSFYDYKKRFSALETFDWNGNWLPL